MIETELRALVRSAFERDTWRDAFGVAKIQEFENRRTEEAKRRQPAVVTPDLLQYTHFYELRTVLVANWDRFTLALGKRREFEVWADQIEDFRNAPAHSRELLPFERSLLEGIAGSIRTKVTVFRSSQDSNMSYYPIIESVVDSFGHRLDDIGPNDAMGAQFSTDIKLLPGQEVIFHARGWDPQGRELTWRLLADGVHVLSVVGSEVDLPWIVRKQDVGMNRHMYIVLSSSGDYHRHTHYDHRAIFRYQVDPPEDS